MKHCITGLILLVSGQVMAAAAPAEAYPSCNLQAQRNVAGTTGGEITDVREAHISVRVNVLQADTGSARKARLLTQAQADRLWRDATQVRSDARQLVRQQGFLSAAERASYDRALDELARQLCSKLRN
ncbi:hypothetical protein N4G40_09625 [Pantoea eucrina]|uniref:Uncharacterized protein n=1 Tax=Pantoea eucrina TaxID=472693 RepID=A0ABU5LFN3_9GAMM|nr:hypothetical protein [Pantoea eucrina]MDZ7278531.1 hypothetical protein [Pantoea eucrina]